MNKYVVSAYTLLVHMLEEVNELRECFKRIEIVDKVEKEIANMRLHYLEVDIKRLLELLDQLEEYNEEIENWGE